MPEIIDGLAIRRRLGRHNWSAPRPWGPDGFAYVAKNGNGAVIVTGFNDDDGVLWIHASMTREATVPSYDDLKFLHAAVWPDGNAYQAFVPPAEHVNIHPRALHLWGRADGARLLPDLPGGTI